MKNMNRKMNQRGYTLLEVVTVMTIISALAAILIPSIFDYIKKAQRAADKVTARLIGTSVVQLMVENYDFYDQFYACDTMKFEVYVDGEHYWYANVCRCDGSKNCMGYDVEAAKYVDPTEYRNGKKSGRGWEFTSNSKKNKKVTDTLNRHITDIIGGNGESFIPMYSSGYKHPASECNHDRNYTKNQFASQYANGILPSSKSSRDYSLTYSFTDKWLIGYHTNNKDATEKGQPEVWAGDSYGKGANGPRVRLWPAPPSYY